MAEERLVESIKINCYPKSYFNWYERTSTWLGKVSNRYEIIIRNQPVHITTVSNVGENPVNASLRERIASVCRLINDCSLGEVELCEEPFLTSRKVIEIVNLFNRLHLISNRSYKPNEDIEFKLFSNGISNTYDGSDPFVVYKLEISLNEYIHYIFKYYGRVGERSNTIKLNYYQLRVVKTLVRASILCNIEEGGSFGHVNFYNIPSLIEKAKKYGILKIVPNDDTYYYSGRDEYREKCLNESK